MLLNAFLAVSLCAAPLPQTDRFVDPANGSDQATGTSPSSAWKTLTRGFDLVAPGTTIKVLPGVLDAASGEEFPLVIPSNVSIESTEGRDVTRIDCGVGIIAPERSSRIKGFDIRGQATQLIAYQNWFFTPDPPPSHIDDCIITSLNGDGIYARGLEMRNCTVSAARRAVTVLRGDFSAWDCSFEGNASGGGCALQFSTEYFAGSSVLVERCTVSSEDGCGVRVGCFNVGDTLSFRFLNSVFRDCAEGGILIGNNDDRDLVVEIDGCTVVRNSNIGVGTFVQGSETLDVSIRSSIIAGQTGVDVVGPVVAVDSLIEDGTASGAGCLSGDPRFIDAANGDLRLRFDSPCKDNGQALGDGLDVTRRERDIDGDLDLAPAPDMGAFEHRTLVAPSAVSLGDPLVLGMTGPAGGFSFLVIDLNGLQPTTLSTPYGELHVYGPTAQRLPPVATTGGSPTLQTLPPFMDPALVGSSVGFQALTRSTAAPSQAAFSNPVSVTIE